MSALDVATVVFGLIGGVSITAKAICEVVVGQMFDRFCARRQSAAAIPAVPAAGPRGDHIAVTILPAQRTTTSEVPAAQVC
jgi:hypothetical protein